MNSTGSPSYTGSLKLANGTTCNGYVNGSQFSGIILLPDGNKILGDFKYIIDFTTGVEIVPDSSIDFYKHITSAGDIYVGKISKAFKRQGTGMCYYKNGDIYIGDFRDNKRYEQGLGSADIDLRYTPHGLLMMKNGDIYRGNFENDIPQGWGEYITRSGLEKYQGSFNKGMKDGEGMLTRVNESPRKVMYVNGV